MSSALSNLKKSKLRLSSLPKDANYFARRKRKHSESGRSQEGVKVRREQASTFTATVDKDVKRKLEILKSCTLRPIVIYYEPADAHLPTQKWRIYPFKQEQCLRIMYVHRQSSYIIGRNAEVSAIQINHCSCSNQHAVLQYREIAINTKRVVRPFIMDLKSMNGTFVNGVQIAPLKYVELFEKDVIEFGFSTREYILLHENSDCLSKNPRR